MQLPRGTFHSMKKGMKLGVILDSLKEEAFSGSCSLICENHTISLVLESGNIVLASVDSSCGDAAIAMMTEIQDCIAAASLSDLTPAQMKLTLEFNTESRVRQRKTPVRKTPDATHDAPLRVREEKTPGIAREGRMGTDVHPATSPSTAPGSRSPARIVPRTSSNEEKPVTPQSPSADQKPPVQQSTPEARRPSAKPKGMTAETAGQEGEDYIVMNRELDALDSMDLDSMSDKIRANCRSMIEKLHLEHLMEHQGD